VLIDADTDGEAIEQFRSGVAEAWEGGRKKIDERRVLVIAKTTVTSASRSATSLEGALTMFTSKSASAPERHHADIQVRPPISRRSLRRVSRMIV